MPIYSVNYNIFSDGGGGISLTTNEDEENNLTINFGKNEILEHIEDYDDTIGSIYDQYKFYNSGIVILVEKEDYGGGGEPMNIQIKSPFFKLRERVDSEEIIPQLKGYLDKIVIETLQYLKNSSRMVGKLGLGPNIESRIGQFVSGKKGSTASQLNKLRQNQGISLAPRAGGKRKTVRNRK